MKQITRSFVLLAMLLGVTVTARGHTIICGHTHDPDVPKFISCDPPNANCTIDDKPGHCKDHIRPVAATCVCKRDADPGRFFFQEFQGNGPITIPSEIAFTLLPSIDSFDLLLFHDSNWSECGEETAMPDVFGIFTLAFEPSGESGIADWTLLHYQSDWSSFPLCGEGTGPNHETIHDGFLSSGTLDLSTGLLEGEFHTKIANDLYPEGSELYSRGGGAGVLDLDTGMGWIHFTGNVDLGWEPTGVLEDLNWGSVKSSY